jgi:hypothetical protein
VQDDSKPAKKKISKTSAKIKGSHLPSIPDGTDEAPMSIETIMAVRGIQTESHSSLLVPNATLLRLAKLQLYQNTYFECLKWCSRWDSNPQPRDYEFSPCLIFFDNA